VAIANYSDLRAAVAGWMNRTDLTGLIPDFITLFEAEANRVFRAPQMMTTASPFAVAGRFTALPTDFLQIKRVTSLYQGQRRQLIPIGTEAVSSVDRGTRTGAPVWYDIVDEQIELIPSPGGSMSLELVYFGRITPLAASPTNWLLTGHPDVYLYGSLMQAAIYMQDMERLANYKGLFDQAAGELMRQAKRQQYGSALQMRAA